MSVSSVISAYQSQVPQVSVNNTTQTTQNSCSQAMALSAQPQADTLTIGNQPQYYTYNNYSFYSRGIDSTKNTLFGLCGSQVRPPEIARFFEGNGSLEGVKAALKRYYEEHLSSNIRLGYTDGITVEDNMQILFNVYSHMANNAAHQAGSACYLEGISL
jgi:hypothetical protein